MDSGGSQTVVRGGFGFIKPGRYSIITNFAQNLPFFVTRTVSSSALRVPVVLYRQCVRGHTVGPSALTTSITTSRSNTRGLEPEHGTGDGERNTDFGCLHRSRVHPDSATVRNVPFPGPGAIAARRPVHNHEFSAKFSWINGDITSDTERESAMLLADVTGLVELWTGRPGPWLPSRKWNII